MRLQKGNDLLNNSNDKKALTVNSALQKRLSMKIFPGSIKKWFLELKINQTGIFFQYQNRYVMDLIGM